MAASINQVIVSGNLTRDPELRATASGMPILAFGVAVNDRRKNAQTGEWEDYPNFLDVTVFGREAEWLAPKLSKGTGVVVSGKLRWSQWDVEGGKRSKVEIIADNVKVLQRNSPADGQQQQYAAPQPGAPASIYADQDIPF